MTPHRSIDAQYIQSLLDGSVPENQTLDYKRDLPKKQDGSDPTSQTARRSSDNSSRNEFLKDVCAFANAAGGDLIYGIEEKGGEPAALVGVVCEDRDGEIRRLSEMIRGGIEPDIHGIQIEMVAMPDGPRVFVVRVSKSWNGPHRLKRSREFYVRSDTQCRALNYTEIRSAFEHAGGVLDRIRRWRDERLGRLIAGEGPVRLLSSRLLILHVVPLESFADEWRFSVQELEPLLSSCGGFYSKYCNDRFINLDGYVLADPKDVSGEYVQVFRSGRIEASTTHVFCRDKDGSCVFDIDVAKQAIFHAATRYFEFLKQLQLQSQVVVLGTIIGVRGCRVYSHAAQTRRDYRLNRRQCDRDDLLLPEVIAETLDVNLPQLLRPVIDAIWNAFGMHYINIPDSDGY